MNKVILIGNLVRDPELSQTPSGVSVCKYSIAVNRRFADADGNRQCDFFNIVTWRGLADNCGKFLKKGTKVGIVGALQTRSWEQDGVKKYATDIVADEVEFLSPKSSDQPGAPGDVVDASQGASQMEMTPVSDDNLPF